MSSAVKRVFAEREDVRFEDLLVGGELSYGIVQPGDHTEENSVPVIRVNNVRNERIDPRNILCVSKEVEGKYSRTRLRGGELLIVVVGSGSVGNCVLVPSEFAGWNVARAIAVARLNSKCHPPFILYQFRTDEFLHQIYGGTTDTAQPTLNLSTLRQCVFQLPVLSEQRAIADVLSSLDDKIDLLNRQNKTLEAMAETLFRQWFVEEASDEWEECTLADVAVNPRVSARVGEISPDAKYVGLEHIDRRCIALHHHGCGLDVTSNKSRFLANDILFGKLRPYFHKVCYAPFDGICSTDILVVRPKQPELLAYCLFAFFQDDVVEYANQGSGGTRMPRTSWQTLSDYPIQKPSTVAIDRFNKIVLPALSKITSNLNSIANLQMLRDTLLPKLMSGEVRVAP